MHNKILVTPATVDHLAGSNALGVGLPSTTALANFLSSVAGTGTAPASPVQHNAVAGNDGYFVSSAGGTKRSATMTPAEAAVYLGVKEATLATWRSTRRYRLDYVKVGRRIFYTKAALDKFMAARTVTFDD
ncbi:MAG TPA: helix-turn-helix domain-containing protein [Noviherbaspirillum sp.]|uniref:helix-turn-helix domain-containing protein n=1 Tax=Noviherbaspirillum sp. TaxID=1926288 RepID=UPI002D6F906C|nr:helix-turn-helix domain-containing protein [Noviherbaspirillum sp.]HYD95258.1 helix-turn-helix domain-containing protein [Noviherbaspirillum sp.]